MLAKVTRPVRRVLAALMDLLPAPPVESAPPDIDGHRPSEVDSEDLLRVKVAEKGSSSSGGFR